MRELVCTICGKKAVGCQVFGCCGSYVCHEHADKPLQELKPGEKLDLGGRYYLRLKEESDEEGDTSVDTEGVDTSAKTGASPAP